MAVELIKDKIKIEQLVAREEIQALVEGEITLPENKPKIGEIVKLSGTVEITNQLLREDSLIVTGMVNYHTLYTTEEDETQHLHGLETKADFREEISLEESYDQAVPIITANIEHIEFTKITDYKVGVKTVVDIRTKLQLDNTVETVSEIEGGEGIQVLKETIKYNDNIGSSLAKNIVKETIELADDMPSVSDILKVDANVYESETRVVEGKVIVGGTVDYFVMYYSNNEEDKVKYVKQEVPFTHFVEIPGALNDMNYELSLLTQDINYNARGDINGDLKIIDVECAVKIEAKVYTDSEQEVITDSYSTINKFNIKNEKIVVSESLLNKSLEETLKQVIDVSSQGDKLSEVCNVNARPIVSEYRLVEGKLILEGLIEVDVLYLADGNGNLKNIKQEVPYKSYIDIEESKSSLDVEISNILRDIRYDKISDQEIEVEVVLKNQVNINRVKNINIVTQASELEEKIDKDSRPSITIYMVQKDDNVWDIAKRYNTTVEEIIQTNEIIGEENIAVGEKIIIEKHVESVFQI